MPRGHARKAFVSWATLAGRRVSGVRQRQSECAEPTRACAAGARSTHTGPHADGGMP